MALGVLGPSSSSSSPYLLLPFRRPSPSPTPSHLLFPPESSSLARSSPRSSPLMASEVSSPSSRSSPSSVPSLLVFSGGTAFNGVVEELKKVTTRVAHVLPVSDDGGSTAEIVRVLGGPAVGDIRSRCLRLSDESTSEALAVRTLLGHRLPLDSSEAKLEWYKIVEGEHSLWDDVSRPYRETIRAFLAYFQNQDGTIIRGQNEISHPTNGRTEPINKVFPAANPTVLEQLSKVDCIVYAMGSLYTSICPSLVLHGIGESIASTAIPKVLLLNGSHDRETAGLSASGFVTAITDALNRTYGEPVKSLKNPPSDYINALLVPRDGRVPVDTECLAAQGIFRVVNVDSVRDPKVGIIFDPKSLINALTNLICEQRDFCATC